MTGFKRRAVSPDRVAAVESVTADVPIVGDPRMAPAELALPEGRPQLAETKVGSSQDGLASLVAYQVGNVYDIPVGLIRSNPFNPRAVYTATAIDAMAISLSTSGQRISATGYSDDQGYVTLIEGETRLRGARAAGLATLRVEIRPRPASDRGLYEEARAANVERREQTPLDDAIKWKELLGKKVYPTQVALANALNLGEDHVSRTLSLASLPGRVIHAVAECPELLTHKMLNALREFWEAQGDEETLELILEITKNGMGYRDVVARRKAAVNGPVRRPRSVRQTVTFKGAKGEIKSFEEDGRLELSLKGLTPESASELTDKLMELFPRQ
jgi:ParB family chromosome partitioning protein